MSLVPNDLRRPNTYRYCVEHIFLWHYKNQCVAIAVELGRHRHIFIVDALEATARYLLNIVGHDLRVFFNEYSLVQKQTGRLVLNEIVALEAYGVEDRHRRPSVRHHSPEYLRRVPDPNFFELARTNYNLYSARDIRQMEDDLRQNRPFLAEKLPPRQSSTIDKLWDSLNGKPTHPPRPLPAPSPFHFVEIRLHLRLDHPHHNRRKDVSRFVFHAGASVAHLRDAIQFCFHLDDTEVHDPRFWFEVGLPLLAHHPSSQAAANRRRHHTKSPSPPLVEPTISTALVRQNHMDLSLELERVGLLPLLVRWGDLQYALLVPPSATLQAAVWGKLFEPRGVLEHSTSANRRLNLLLYQPGKGLATEALMERRVTLKQYGIQPFGELQLVTNSMSRVKREQQRKHGGGGIVFVYDPSKTALQLHVKVPAELGGLTLSLDVDEHETPWTLWQVLEQDFGVKERIKRRADDAESNDSSSGGFVFGERVLRLANSNRLIRGTSRRSLRDTHGVVSGDKLYIEERFDDDAAQHERDDASEASSSSSSDDGGDSEPSGVSRSSLVKTTKKTTTVIKSRETTTTNHAGGASSSSSSASSSAATEGSSAARDSNNKHGGAKDEHVRASCRNRLRPKTEHNKPIEHLIETAKKLILEVERLAGDHWKAEFNQHFAQMQDSDRQRLLGITLMEPGHEEHGPAGVGYSKRMNNNNKHKSTIPLPVEFDAVKAWPDCAHVIGVVEDQANCGSCWAVSAAQVLTDRFCIALVMDALSSEYPRQSIVEIIATLRKRHSDYFPFTLSARDLLACSSSRRMRGKDRNEGCEGGATDLAWGFMQKFGLVTGGAHNTPNCCQPYPFAPSLASPSVKGFREPPEEATPKCEMRCTGDKHFPFEYKADKFYASEIGYLSGKQQEEEIMREILDFGPVQASMCVFDDLFHYKAGVYRHVAGEYLGGHAVRIVGWGVDLSTEMKYWKVANSWGKDWGENGFFRIARGSDACSIESWRVEFGVPSVHDALVLQRLKYIRKHLDKDRKSAA